ncbi:hypothetical protein ACHAWX_000782 [Stephanocyclus meneghinianus]
MKKPIKLFAILSIFTLFLGKSICHAFTQISPLSMYRRSMHTPPAFLYGVSGNKRRTARLPSRYSLILHVIPREASAVVSVKNHTAPHLKRDLHVPTVDAISHALLVRSQNKPDMPLRFIDNGSMEPWQLTLTAGNIAQRHVEEWRGSLTGDSVSEEVEEEAQVIAGRIVAVLTRLEELEEELLRRCERWTGEREDCDRLGVPVEEINAWKNKDDSLQERIEKAAAVIDAACLFDQKLRQKRARTLLAMFLQELEGPGLRKNNVILPCMEVDFLNEREWEIVFGSSAIASRNDTVAGTNDATDSESYENREVKVDTPIRPSLHPLVIDAIEEAFRLRAKNMTTSPFRIIDSTTEWFEVQYSIVKFADRFLQQYSKSTNPDMFQWTEEELQTIGGRIVGVLMRLDDLEWEWNHRIRTSSLGEIESPTRIPDDEWKVTLGLHPGVEQVCFRTVDMALLEEKEFARKRAERMYALFLMNIEEPALKASGNTVPGGSFANEFIHDSMQLELMMPRLKK